MTPKVLTPEKPGRELARVLHTIRRLREELANLNKDARGRIARLEDRASELCDVVAGRAGVLAELDTGTDETAEVLATARKGRSRKFPLGSGLEEPCTKCGKPFGDHAGTSCP